MPPLFPTTARLRPLADFRRGVRFLKRADGERSIDAGERWRCHKLPGSRSPASRANRTASPAALPRSIAPPVSAFPVPRRNLDSTAAALRLLHRRLPAHVDSSRGAPVHAPASSGWLCPAPRDAETARSVAGFAPPIAPPVPATAALPLVMRRSAPALPSPGLPPLPALLPPATLLVRGLMARSGSTPLFLFRTSSFFAFFLG